jgi:hypothetical protein
MIAYLDSVIYGVKLKYNHWLGLASCMLCTLLLGLSKIDIGKEVLVIQISPVKLVPVWMPLIIAFFAAVFISVNSI